MDAGDTNKYVTFADHTVHMLLHAYQANPDAWGDDHSIPESGNGIPDIIDEINYELEWVKKMQDSDGGVFIKAGDRTDVSSSPPSTHTTTRYYGRKASSSTIVLASIFAHAAYVYKDIPGLQDYANDLLVKAESAWLHYSNNPRTDSADNGEIRSGDADRTLVEQDRIAVSASMWLWAATSKAQYHDYFKANYNVMEVMQTGWWGPYGVHHQETLLSYTNLPNCDQTVAQSIVNSKTSGTGNSNYYRFFENSALYRADMDTSSFHWGSNMARADAGTLNMHAIDYGINPAHRDSYNQRALEILHWFHGVNPIGKMMLSNMYDYGAENSVNEFFHTWFTEDSEWDNALTGKGPAPGYIAGGPNASYSGSYANATRLRG